MQPPIPRHILAVSIVLAGVTGQASAHASAAIGTRADMGPVVVLQSDGTYRSVPLSEVRIGGPGTSTNHSTIATAAQGAAVNVSQLRQTDQPGFAAGTQNTYARDIAHLPTVALGAGDASYGQGSIAIGHGSQSDAVAIGSLDTAAGQGAIAIGDPANHVIDRNVPAPSDNSFGSPSSANGQGAIAIGDTSANPPPVNVSQLERLDQTTTPATGSPSTPGGNITVPVTPSSGSTNAPAAAPAAVAQPKQGPDVSGANNAAANLALHLMEDASQSRYESLRPRSQSEEMGIGIWTRMMNGNGHQDRRQQVAGFDMNASGIVIGADYPLAPGMTTGVAYAYLNSNLRSDSGTKTDAESHSLSLYSHYRAEQFFLHGSLSYGWNDYHGQRGINGSQVTGNYDGNLLGLSLLTGYSFDIGAATVIEPLAAARYSKVTLDSYREKGADDALHVNEQRYESGQLGAGVRLAGNLPFGQGQLVPGAKAMVWHDVIGDRVSVTSSYVNGGDNFVSAGVRQSRDSYGATASLDYQVEALGIGISYQYEAGSDFDGRALVGHMSYSF